MLSKKLVLSLFTITALSAMSAVPANASSSDRPFKATFSITETLPVQGNCPLTAGITGTGTASHLGRSTVSSNDCIYPVSAAVFRFTSPQVTLTAANGDKVFATYSGTFSPATGQVSGAYHISGGTGRFENATGMGTVLGSEHVSEVDQSTGVSTFEGEIELAGTISY